MIITQRKILQQFRAGRMDSRTSQLLGDTLAAVVFTALALWAYYLFLTAVLA